MEDVVQIPLKEYQAMKEKLSLLEDSEFMNKLARLVDLLYEEKYGLYMGNNTSDLTAASMQKAFEEPNTAWDNV
jgi:hypothetical protein